jgi:NodT family efflux transporter outer membrane factor (OMF) lipoprotein
VRLPSGCISIRRLAVSLVLAGCMLATSGCMLGPDFQRPAFTPPARYTHEATTDVTAAANVPGGGVQQLDTQRDIPGDWWTLFHSPAIDALVAAALRDNPGLDAANATLDQARALARAQQGTLWPSLSGTLGSSRQATPQTYEYGSTTPALTYNEQSVQLNLSYTLDFWGGLRRAVEQSHAQVDYQRFQLEAAYLALTAEVVNNAIQLASLRQQIDAQQTLIGFEQQQLETVHGQFEIGAATASDLAQQQAQLAQAQAILVPLQTQLAQTRDQLAAYLGQAPADVAIPDIDLDALTLPADVPLTLPSTLVEQRPDIRAAEAMLHAQTAALGVAIAQRFPNVTLNASYGSDAATVGKLFTPTNVLWSAAAQAVQPIFDAGQLKHKQQAQQAQVHAAAAQWRNQVVLAFQNVADTLVALQNDARNLQYVLTAKQAAERSLQLTSAQYKLGGVSYLNVLSAEQTYQNTVLALIRARTVRFTDTVALYQALGGGWWHRQDVAPPATTLAAKSP